MKNPINRVALDARDIAVIAAGLSVPMITSNFGSDRSIQTHLKILPSTGWQNSTVRHSMLKIRLGAVPETEVKTPQVPPGKAAQPLRPNRCAYPAT